MKVCVFGAASDKIDKSYIDLTCLLGKKFGEKGHTLVFGAGGEGLMGAVARGFKESNSEIYGVVPTFFLDDKIEGLYEECTKMITTETMRERKAIMEDMADAFVIVPGGIGTFEEFFEIVTLKQLGRHNKPIAIYNINGYYDHMEKMMLNSVKEGFVREKCSDLYRYFDDADSLIDFIENDKGCDWNLVQLKKN
ncbi:MAG: TIGR00730 family Rossman fold protein [Oscillospiraceae bacterium]|nr:TIGR00730 family Rossman fold protein [Oscillospiraceae bacterium]